jgi:Zn-dependent peptidase ImmA (M78 family)
VKIELWEIFLGNCTPDYQGHYHIKIKESVYEGACEGIGGYRMHIMHEIAHAFLCLLGFTPILDRQFKNNALKPYESMEWQAKALAGEILMENELTKGMSAEELINKCGVSLEGAVNRTTRK